MTFALSSVPQVDGAFSIGGAGVLHVVTGYEDLAAGIRARQLLDVLFPGEGIHIHHAPYNYAMLARPDLKECIASRTAEAALVIISASYGPLPHYVVEWVERSVREARHEVRIIVCFETPRTADGAPMFNVESDVFEMARRCQLHCRRLSDDAIPSARSLANDYPCDENQQVYQSRDQ